MKLRISAAVRTHCGKIRANNEDNYFLCGKYRRKLSENEKKDSYCGDDRKVVCAVCDGMGGEAYGEKASLIAVRHLKACRIEDANDAALHAIQTANEEICREIRKNAGKRIGTTLAALYIDQGKAVCCNVGDSRIYLFRENKLRQLSVDHNNAQRLVRMGVITPEAARNHPGKHQLTQHLGIFEYEMQIVPEFSETIELQVDDVFVVCSDGLTDMLSDEEIRKTLATAESAEQAAQNLTEQALCNGGRDNITVLVVQVQKQIQESQWMKFKNRLKIQKSFNTRC